MFFQTVRAALLFAITHSGFAHAWLKYCANILRKHQQLFPLPPPESAATARPNVTDSNSLYRDAVLRVLGEELF